MLEYYTLSDASIDNIGVYDDIYEKGRFFNGIFFGYISILYAIIYNSKNYDTLTHQIAYVYSPTQKECIIIYIRWITQQ